MNPIPTRKFVRQVSKYARANGYAFFEDPKRGKGDHRCYVVRDAKSGHRFPIVFDGGRTDLPPGTRRQIAKSLERQADEADAIAPEVRGFLRRLAEFIRSL